MRGLLVFLIAMGLLGSNTFIPSYQIAPPLGKVTPATYMTVAVAQSGAPLFCQSSNGTTMYYCNLGNGTLALSTLTFGMMLVLYVDVPCSTGCSLNAQVPYQPAGLPSAQVTIDQTDGVTNAAVTAGVPHLIFYNGTVWELII